MDSAHYLVNRLMGRDPSYHEEFDEMDLSAMKEIGNIIAGSYLNALSSLWGLGEVITVAAWNLDYMPSERVGEKLREAADLARSISKEF